MYALRERRVHVTQEDFELAVAKVTLFISFLVSTFIWFYVVNKVCRDVWGGTKITNLSCQELQPLKNRNQISLVVT
jgi:hypothetical protein